MKCLNCGIDPNAVTSGRCACPTTNTSTPTCPSCGAPFAGSVVNHLCDEFVLVARNERRLREAKRILGELLAELKLVMGDDRRIADLPAIGKAEKWLAES